MIIDEMLCPCQGIKGLRRLEALLYGLYPIVIVSVHSPDESILFLQSEALESLVKGICVVAKVPFALKDYKFIVNRKQSLTNAKNGICIGSVKLLY